jgi:hypothetical protein
MTPVIYTISKNEAANVEGFMAAAQGAARTIPAVETDGGTNWFGFVAGEDMS